ncbi:MAG: PTS sugar transporter subunit IIA [Planctomycetota bacterium]|nr:PTS sugar transporter subunit IIA [Planctomycetota bacterium]
MEIREFLTPERVILLAGSTKTEVLDELADLMVRADAGINHGQLQEAIHKREKLMSTGIGHGLAIPHVRLAGLRDPLMAIGVCRDGIDDYESLDNKPVRIVILIAAPAGQHEVYIRLLAKASDVLKLEEIRRSIVESDSPEEIYRILTGDE